MKLFLTAFALLGSLGIFSRAHEVGSSTNGVAAASAPSITLDKNAFAPGESLSVHFSNGPGNALDWIAIFEAETREPKGRGGRYDWLFVNGTKRQTEGLKEGTVTFEKLKMPRGLYNVWFLQNNGYKQLAGPIPFKVGDPGPLKWWAQELKPRHAVVGVKYEGNISAWASERARVKFKKLSGPSWLEVSEEGILSGTPTPQDVGTSPFLLEVAQPFPEQSATVKMTIPVFHGGQERVTTLTVMSYNTWVAGTRVTDGFEKGVASIVRAGADVVGLQESNPTHAQRLADALGWYRAQMGAGGPQIVSRYPIVEEFAPGSISTGARIRLTEQPLREIILVSCHLPASHYGPYRARGPNATRDDIVAVEHKSGRVKHVKAILADLGPYLKDANFTPVFLVGDFNAPSHLDWTSATSAKNFGIKNMPWPVSREVQDARMQDSYRVVHPSPSANPGNTWSAFFKETEPQDRIDFIYFRGSALRVLSSQTFTTEVQATTGPEGSPIHALANNTWPSDHAAVVSVFHIAPPQRTGRIQKSESQKGASPNKP